MVLSTSIIIGALFSGLAAAMSLPTSMRDVAQSLSLLILILLALIILTRNRWVYLDKRVGTLVLALTVLTLTNALTMLYLGQAGRGLLVQIFSLINLVLLALAANYFDMRKLMKGYALVSVLIFVATFPLFISGIELFSNENSYAMLLCPALIYWIHVKKAARGWLLFTVLGVLTCNFLGARLALILFLLIYASGYVVPRRGLVRGLAMTLLCAMVAANVYFTFHFDFAVNYALTNRVFIWNYYGDLFWNRPWLGHGFISSDASGGAALDLSGFVNRGVNERYGTQSMYVLYLYQNGIVGFAVMMCLFAYILKTAQRFFWPIFIMLLAALSETVALGVPSIIGVPLTLFCVMGLLEGKTANRSPMTPNQPRSGQALRGPGSV